MGSPLPERDIARPPVGPSGRVLVPWQFVTVVGPSMVPTLRHGDRLLVRRRAVAGRRGPSARPGDVVLARFDDLPDRLVVKRLVSWTAEPGRAALASDNAAAGGDSRTHGPGLVLGRVLLVRHGRRWRRVAAAPAL